MFYGSDFPARNKISWKRCSTTVLVIGEPGDIGTRRSLYPRTSSELGDVEASVFFRTMAAKT